MLEEYRSGNPDYPCCTSRGSVVALDANTGKQIWKTYVVDEPKPTKKNSHGRQLYTPSGGSIWNSPTIDPVRHAVYVGTGDASSEPSPKTTDAVMALDMDTGKILWAYQATEKDSFMGGCVPVKSEACPSEIGPDADIGNSPILRSLPGGERVVIAATKGGDIFALDPDNNGRLLWRMNYSGRPRSGSLFGGTADEQNVYYGFTGGGVAAVGLANGERKWFARITPADARVAHSAAATAIPGVVFQGGQDGMLTALSAADGHILWQYNTDRFFETVNKIPAHGVLCGRPARLSSEECCSSRPAMRSSARATPAMSCSRFRWTKSKRKSPNGSRRGGGNQRSSGKVEPLARQFA